MLTTVFVGVSSVVACGVILVLRLVTAIVGCRGVLVFGVGDFTPEARAQDSRHRQEADEAEPKDCGGRVYFHKQKVS